MAKVFDNILISGLRGRVGSQLVFRVVNGVTIACRAPKRPDRKKQSAAQRQTRETFRTASQWAKTQIANPKQKHYYMQLAKTWNLTNAYTAAIKDYMRNVKKLETSEKGDRPSQYPRHKATAELQQNQVRVQSSLLRDVAPIPRKSCRITDIQPVKPLRFIIPDSAQAMFERYLHLNGRLETRHLKQRPDALSYPVSDRPSLSLREGKYRQRIVDRAAVEQT